MAAHRSPSSTTPTICADPVGVALCLRQGRAPESGDELNALTARMLRWLAVPPRPIWLPQGLPVVRPVGHPDRGPAFRAALDGSLAQQLRGTVRGGAFPIRFLPGGCAIGGGKLATGGQGIGLADLRSALAPGLRRWSRRLRTPRPARRIATSRSGSRSVGIAPSTGSLPVTPRW